MSVFRPNVPDSGGGGYVRLLYRQILVQNPLYFLNSHVCLIKCVKKIKYKCFFKFNNDTASLKIKNSIGSITQKMSNA